MYQPALDGVRAIAVAMVLGFHLGLSSMARGHMGVDMFFVLSGYLITSILLREQATAGRISLKNFYVRRFLRLAPLAITVTILCLLLNEVGMAGNLGLRATRPASFSVLFYYANWWLIGHPLTLGPLLPMWSLSIEEQFYLLWPLVLVTVFALAGRHARFVLIVATTTGILTMGIARQVAFDTAVRQEAASGHVTRLFFHVQYSSFLRPDGLLIGCLAALLLFGHRAARRTDATVRVIGMVGIAVALLAIILRLAPSGTAIWQVQPGWVLSLFNLGTAAGIAWLVVAPSSVLARGLSIRPLIWIGRRSYGIYVLHLLVFSMIDSRWTLAGLTRLIVLPTATLVAAGLSYRFLETPFLRLKERFARR